MATILESPRATNIVILSIDREFVLLVDKTKQSSVVVVVVVQSYWFTTILYNTLRVLSLNHHIVSKRFFFRTLSVLLLLGISKFGLLKTVIH